MTEEEFSFFYKSHRQYASMIISKYSKPEFQQRFVYLHRKLEEWYDVAMEKYRRSIC